ncbi:hypothetical protein H310_11865 [Aphanomyces invadans]|uniref:Uncharacterized protein n=1 Tax=Aphanomyces invadans TaxID=157072 RepID=A0A024TKS1_9STRA|nr:hypothetical protein H310_11865 [Aphanomyces invadans]ETV94604.1 hypothetical protein H310_11865 [Aphanomyces invadans]RHY29735.1 hypothetical protein DYB32_004891 [Aphanomyces invadans]|eukprot:XP_008876919.1 hypothetical protein H310_11865 [Aphanomyces invadans]
MKVLIVALCVALGACTDTPNLRRELRLNTWYDDASEGDYYAQADQVAQEPRGYNANQQFHQWQEAQMQQLYNKEGFGN